MKVMSSIFIAFRDFIGSAKFWTYIYKNCETNFSVEVKSNDEGFFDDARSSTRKYFHKYYGGVINESNMTERLQARVR